MYEHKTAYRHRDGSVEGFLGTGNTKAKAKADAVEQMKRKADGIAAWNQDDTTFDKDRVIAVLSSMTPAEIAAVQEDWRSGTRY